MNADKSYNEFQLSGRKRYNLIFLISKPIEFDGIKIRVVKSLPNTNKLGLIAKQLVAQLAFPSYKTDTIAL